MINYKLPIRDVFLKALSLPVVHYRALLKVGFPLIVLGVILTTFISFFSYGEGSAALMLLGVVLWIAFCVSLVMAIVGCHRIFIIGQSVVEGRNLFAWTGNELSYAGWWLLIGICSSLIALPFALLFIPFMSDSLSNIFENEVVLFTLLGFINIPVYYVASRWSLVLPSSAVDIHEKSFSWSWGLSDGNGWRLTLLIGLLPFSLDILFSLLPEYESLIYSLFTGAVWLVVGVVEIGLLSISYSLLVSNENQENIEVNELN